MAELEAGLVCMFVAGECGRPAPTASCRVNSEDEEGGGEEAAGTLEAGSVAYRSILSNSHNQHPSFRSALLYSRRRRGREADMDSSS